MRRIEEFWIEFEEEKASSFSEFFYDACDSLKGAIITVFLIFAFAFRVVGVEGNSMRNTLNDGDWLAVSGITTEFKRGDIVVVNQPWERNVPIIKRVIGIEGDTVYIDFSLGKVYINGEEIDEPYIDEPTHLSYDVEFPVTVGDNQIFVMGDNRNDSLDSRSGKIGMIDVHYVLGKAVFRLYPFEERDIY
ncbi:MAG: signal peptidase I [Clostridia bacterium]|nr:signal peptidase I [Clostridia bacterium]